MTGFDAASFLALVRNYGHNRLLDIRYLDHGEDWAELLLPYAPALTVDEGTGTLASGPIVSLMDMAASVSFWLRAGRFRPCATLDLRIDYLRAAAAGAAVTARMECYRLTRRVGFVRGQAHDGDAGDPIAHAAATFMFTDGD